MKHAKFHLKKDFFSSQKSNFTHLIEIEASFYRKTAIMRQHRRVEHLERTLDIFTDTRAGTIWSIRGSH